MSWRLLTDDWRVKLLAVALAILMLGAVAFSQNPPTSKTLTVGISYANTTDNPVVVVNGPSKISVTVTAVANLIAAIRADNLTATIDVSHVKPGAAQRLDIVVSSTYHDVNPIQPAPIVVDVESLVTKDVPVEVQANAAPGWNITNRTANPTSVHFTGPASWMNNLHAYVSYPGLVEAEKNDSPNQPVQLANNNGRVDYTTCGDVTVPSCSLDINAVSVHVDAVPGSTSRSVPVLVTAWSHGPAAGYQVTNVTVTPNPVIISGTATAVDKVRNFTLPAADLSGRTSNATFQVEIPYPSNVTGNAATVTVVYSISRIPTPSPTPSP